MGQLAVGRRRRRRALLEKGEQAAAVVRNVGPAKQAIFQKLELAACSYLLTADVAAAELSPNDWGRAATVHISMDNGEPSITHDVFRTKGSDWHKLTLIFTLTRASVAHLYFFNYGSGSYFVRNVELKPLPGCAVEKASYSLTAIPNARLTYEPPPTAADFA
ncbi:MAG: hypothetical protein HC909_02160, partial [Blastochloris sp.]|nr:hypothetical protein [Blastochloris sp.]